MSATVAAPPMTAAARTATTTSAPLVHGMRLPGSAERDHLSVARQHALEWGQPVLVRFAQAFATPGNVLALHSGALRLPCLADVTPRGFLLPVGGHAPPLDRLRPAKI